MAGDTQNGHDACPALKNREAAARRNRFLPGSRETAEQTTSGHGRKRKLLNRFSFAKHGSLHQPAPGGNP